MTRGARLAALLVAAVIAPAVSAQEGGNGPQPVRVTTFPLAHPGVDEKALAPVMRALGDGLKRNPRLEMKDLDARLADFAQEIPQEEIDQGRLLLQEGQKALTGLELPTAIKKLTQAVETLSKVLPYIKKQELADAMMALGAAQYEQGEKRDAKRTFERLLVWRDDYKVDLKRYPPRIFAVVEEVRKEVQRSRRGSIEIRTDPPAAQAYVDGRYVGVTPCYAEGLVVGEHWVTLKKEGYKKAVMPAQVSSRVQEVVKVPIERSTKYLLVQQAIDAIEKSLGEPTLPAAADNLKEVLFIDHAVFVRVTPAEKGSIGVDTFLYDLRTRRRLTRVTKTVPIASAEKDLRTLASSLYLNVSYDVQLVERKDAPPPKPKVRRPFYKTWWFWTAAAVASGGVVLGGVLGARFAPKDCGSSNSCYAVTF